MGTRPAAGGGRWVEVDPARLPRWLDGFAERHGNVDVAAVPDGLRLTAADGAVAQCLAPPGAAPTESIEAFLAEAGVARVAARRVGRFLTIGERKLAVLEAAVRQARSVLIRLVEPEGS